MYSSSFSYNVTRPYPFKWFTWVAVLAGLAFTVLFTVINVAANGYQLQTIYTTDPNTTLRETRWYEHAPWSWSSKLSASCQSQSLAVGTPFFTSNLGFTYTVAKAWHSNTGANLPAAAYLNNTLENCTVNEILVSMVRNDQTQSGGDPWTWGQTQASAAATCSIMSTSGPVMLNFTVNYLPYSGATREEFRFVQLDEKERASIWWGAQLLAYNYWALTYEMSFSSTLYYGNVSEYVGSGTVRVIPNGVNDITSLDFFSNSMIFFLDNGNLQYKEILPLSHWVKDTGLLPWLPYQIDGFSKSFYSTILADLGVKNGPASSSAGIQYLLGLNQGLGSLANTGLSWQIMGYPYAGDHPIIGGYPANESFDALRSTAGNLTVNNATIFAQYACSVPTRKSTGSLLISVIVADLVFLQALWMVLNLAATRWANHKDPEANHCQGCAKRVGPQYQPVNADGHAPLMTTHREHDSPKNLHTPMVLTRSTSSYTNTADSLLQIPRKPVGGGV